MRRLVVVGVAFLGLLGVGAWLFRDALYFMALSQRIKPTLAFEETVPPPAPDYADDTVWAALPSFNDGADFTPRGLSEPKGRRAAAVFFVHPTTFIDVAAWNAPLDDERANTFIDKSVLPAQASAFNSCCDIYAPRYRQATLYSFFDLDGDGGKAVDLAYGDVESAFDAFLARIAADTPIVIAGHSQGGIHILTLLKSRIAGSPLKDRLVAAYVVGAPLPGDQIESQMPDIPVCASATETGCLLGWQSVGPNWQRWTDADRNVCVNPLTWETNGAYAEHGFNLGALSLADNQILPGAADAQCLDGILMVSDLRTDAFNDPAFYMGRDNYHLFDYSLFYVNLRLNANNRVKAFGGQ